MPKRNKIASKILQAEADYILMVKDNQKELKSQVEKLDLLMLVHGWRSYIWDDVETTKTPALEDWNDAGINMKGYVKIWKKEAFYWQILMWLKTGK